MSVLDHNYDFDLTLTYFWKVEVLWYKYTDKSLFEKQLTTELNKDEAWIHRFDNQRWSHPELIELIKSLLSPQASNLSSIDVKEDIYINKMFQLSLKNASGDIVLIKFTKKENPSENQL